MFPFLGSTAIVIASATSFSAPATAGIAQPAPVVAPVVAAAPAGRQRSDQQSVSLERSAASGAAEAIERQQQLHVLMPALTGDGGG